MPADPDTGETLIDRSVITSDDGIYQTLREGAVQNCCSMIAPTKMLAQQWRFSRFVRLRSR